MLVGDLVAGRFEIAREAGAGGMGVVYQAHDHVGGGLVALKIVEGGDARFGERFAREAQVVAGLQHPRIVRYVAHGTLPSGKRYLALEWLAGEDLSVRLARAGLTIAESVAVARTAADALGHAHAHGVVHRDVKPSNIFLVDGDPERATLLDFGIARMGGASDLTLLGARVGTPAYMSPEQARGLAELDARADVFALGVVLYQCLTGRKPFTGDDPMAVIGKVLLADPDPIHEQRSGVPAELEHLVVRMLAKDPTGRPRDGAEVAAALGLLGDVSGEAQVVSPAPSLTGRERRLVAVLLASSGGLRRHAPLQAAVAMHGGRLEPLVDGSVAIALSGTGAATDLAARAARLALAVRELAPVARIALATGSAIFTAEATPIADVVDRAARQLQVAARPATITTPSLRDLTMASTAVVPPLTVDPTPMPTPAPESGGRAIRVDDVTAGLLDARFEVRGDSDGLVLLGERAGTDVARTLLGKPTPCVARDAEIASLEAVYAACVDQPIARAVLITAPAGVGKSRLRYEVLRRLAARDDAPEVLVGRGDPLSAGAPFGLLGGAIRRAAGILDDEPLAVRRKKLAARVGRHLAAAEARRVALFLGEMVGTPFSDDDVQLRAARADAMLMGDQMRRAWEDWLGAECQARPVAIVLEDLHWGDQPTVTFVDAALQALRDRPLFVLALARPDVHGVFPRLWAGRESHEIRLGELGKNASERLVRAVLEERALPALVERIVERAAGNAFYLEELIRAAAEGRTDELPETVLAMVQARLESMEPGARQVLRAASVFGQVFWRGAVRALLGGEERTTQVRDWLAELTRREVITARPTSTLAHEAEFVFRHAIVREAAYAMLTDGDRRLGHRLAAEWLQRAGEPDALVLAEHWERGGEPAQAVGWYRRAAEQALGGNDLPAVLARAERGLSCGGDGEARGALRALAAEAHNWRAEFGEAAVDAGEAMREAPSGSTGWYTAIGEAALAAGVQGESGRLRALHAELDALPWTAFGARAALAATRLTEQLIITGGAELAGELSEGLDRIFAETRESQPAVAGRILAARALQRRFAGDVGAALELAEQACALFERAGDQRNACLQRDRAGYALLELGDHAGAERSLEAAVAAADRMGLQNVAATARHNLGLTLARRGAYERGRAAEQAAIEAFRASGNRRMEGASLEYLALIELTAGDAAAAEQAARAALAVASAPPALPLNRAESLAILGRALLTAGRAGEAREVAAEALALLDELGGIDDGEAIIRLTWAEALSAAGEEEAARAAIAGARARLLQRAGKITDEKLRRAFLEQVPENAKTLALATEWGA